ncbi:MAG: ABC transporter permease [Treponema sp.]|nr:ABC transporter permease [Treponema sp.]
MKIFETFRVFFKYKGLLKQLVARDVKLRYRRSFLGYIWSILNPLLTMTVLTIVFSYFFKREIKNYPVYLLTGQLLVIFFSGATNAAMNSIIANSALLKKIYVPKYVFPLASVTTAFILEFLSPLGALLIVMIATGSPFSVTNLMFILPAFELYIFTLGAGLFLSQITVFFRDVQYLWKALLTALHYLTPIFYPLERVNPTIAGLIIKFNPLYTYVKQFRDFMYDNKFTDPVLILKGFLIAFGMLFIGLVFFKKNQNKFILYI